jgi:hypothetical protein
LPPTFFAMSHTTVGWTPTSMDTSTIITIALLQYDEWKPKYKSRNDINY